MDWLCNAGKYSQAEAAHECENWNWVWNDSTHWFNLPVNHLIYIWEECILLDKSGQLCFIDFEIGQCGGGVACFNSKISVYARVRVIA